MGCSQGKHNLTKRVTIEDSHKQIVVEIFAIISDFDEIGNKYIYSDKLLMKYNTN